MLVTCFHAGFLLRLFFDPENGCDMFLRNVGGFSTEYTALYPKDRTFHKDSYGKVKGKAVPVLN
jgi:hypothetical protein